MFETEFLTQRRESDRADPVEPGDAGAGRVSWLRPRHARHGPQHGEWREAPTTGALSRFCYQPLLLFAIWTQLALNDPRVVRKTPVCTIYHPGRIHLTGALAVEQVARIDAIQQKAIASVTLAICPDWLVAQAAVRSSASGKPR
jgi:hypothetical protein